MDILDTDNGTNINVAATCIATNALGPGLRSVVWVQGCSLNCPGCIAQDWIPIKTARIVGTEELADELLSNPEVSGITISGGEPMLQAQGLIQLVNSLRIRKEINILVFTGYRYENLKVSPPNRYVPDFLAEIDALIDGPYIERLNDNKGLRGSSNQQLIILSNRLSQFTLGETPRKVEVNVLNGQLFIVGVPDQSTMRSFNKFSLKIGAQYKGM